MSAESLKFQFEASGNLIDYVNKSRAAVNNLDGQINRSSRLVQAYGAEHAGLSKVFKFAKGAVQQAGYQVGDYAVQVANGTSKMQAFGQQGAQLAGIFGPVGAVIGAGIAIYSAYAVAVERSATGTKRLSDALKELGSSASDFKSKTMMLEFGVDTEAEATALKEVQRIRKEIADQSARWAETDSLSIRQRIAEEVRASKATLADVQSRIDALVKARQEYEKTLTINKQMNAVELAHARIIGETAAAQKRSLASYNEYYQSRIAGAAMVAIKEGLELKKSHFEQVKIMGESQVKSLNYLRDRKAAWMEYYRSRVLGEKLVAQETEAYGKSVGGGRGGDPRQFTYLDEFRRQLAEDNNYKPPKSASGSDPMRSLVEQIKLREDLIGKTETQKEVISALGVEWKKYGLASINSLSKQIDGIKMQEDAIEALRQKMQSIADVVQNEMTSAFMSIVDGTKSAKDAFKNMARTIIAELYKVLVVQRLVGSFDAKTNTGSGIVGFLGGLFAGKRAQGGQVTAGRSYLVGERGPEVVVPSRNATVLPNGSSNGGGVTVNQNITFGSGVSRAEIQQMLPKIVETTKAAVFDAQRRSVSGMGY